MLINIDHGSIPAATIALKKDLGMDNVALGMLGSLVYLGLTAGNLNCSLFKLGSLLATPLFSYLSAKTILIASFFSNAFALLLFTTSDLYIILATSRFLVGFC